MSSCPAGPKYSNATSVPVSLCLIKTKLGLVLQDISCAISSSSSVPGTSRISMDGLPAARYPTSTLDLSSVNPKAKNKKKRPRDELDQSEQSSGFMPAPIPAPITAPAPPNCALISLFDQDDWAYIAPELREASRVGATSKLSVALNVHGVGDEQMLWVAEISLPPEDGATDGIRHNVGTGPLTSRYFGQPRRIKSLLPAVDERKSVLLDKLTSLLSNPTSAEFSAADAEFGLFLKTESKVMQKRESRKAERRSKLDSRKEKSSSSGPQEGPEGITGCDIDALFASQLLLPMSFKRSICHLCFANLPAYPPGIARFLMEHSQIGSDVLNDSLVEQFVMAGDWDLVMLSLQKFSNISETVIAVVLDKFARSSSYDSPILRNQLLDSVVQAHYSLIPLRQAIQAGVNLDGIAKIVDWVHERLAWSNEDNLSPRSETYEAQSDMALKENLSVSSWITGDLFDIKKESGHRVRSAEAFDKLICFLELILDAFFVRLAQHPSTSHTSLSRLRSVTLSHISRIEDLDNLKGVFDTFGRVLAAERGEERREKKREKLRQEQGRKRTKDNDRSENQVVAAFTVELLEF
ncbi:hypothetical protein BT69DRAFT_1338283 [Atractiella rhizophila]|nr:hypothetical protein BT69DRAFT_1338283 [Atractiella rhizophila]